MRTACVAMLLMLLCPSAGMAAESPGMELLRKNVGYIEKNYTQLREIDDNRMTPA